LVNSQRLERLVVGVWGDGRPRVPKRREGKRGGEAAGLNGGPMMEDRASSREWKRKSCSRSRVLGRMNAARHQKPCTKRKPSARGV